LTVIKLNPILKKVKMTSLAVSDYLERGYFPAYGAPKSIVTDNAKAFCCKEFKDLYFR